MKKIKAAFIVILFLQLSLHANAQYSSIIVFGGINLSKQYYIPRRSFYKDHFKNGYRFGLSFNHSNNNKNGYQIGINIEKKAYSEYGEVNYSSMFPPDPLKTSSYTSNSNLIYINIPLEIYIDYDIGKKHLISSGGFYYANKLSGKYELTRDNGTSYNRSYDPDYLDDDFGFILSTGVELFDDLFINIYLNRSLINLKSDYTYFKSGLFSAGITLSYHISIF